MTFTALLTAIGRRWPVVVATTLIGLAVAGGYLFLTPRSYSATASVYVTANVGTVTPGSTRGTLADAYQGTLLAQQKVQSYPEMVLSDRVLFPVIDELGLRESTADLAGQITVTAPPQGTLLQITVTDRSPQQAADVANAITDRFILAVAQLEQPVDPDVAPQVEVEVVDRARADDTPVSPRLVLTLVIGGALGLLLGAAGAVLRGAADTTLRTPAELAEATGRPVLGVLPADRAVRKGHPLTGRYGDAVRRVRTALVSLDDLARPRVFTVTSADPAEGRTTLVLALAVALAARGRVVVVEGDLRRPVLGRRLGLAEGPGLVGVLEDGIGPREAVRRWADRVDVLPVGSVPADPSELLASERVPALFDRLRAGYDVVLVDAPPLGPLADATVLARASDATILLVRAGTTRGERLTAAMEDLAIVGARLVGVVLTMARSRRAERRRAAAAGRSAARPAPRHAGLRDRETLRASEPAAEGVAARVPHEQAELPHA